MTRYESGTGRSQMWRRWAIWVFLIAVAIGVGISDAKTKKIRSDFSLYSLNASRVMFGGGNPYDKRQVDHNYKYFPANAIVLYPFTLISVYAAQGIWYSINLGLLIWAFGSLRALLRPIKVPWWVTVLALVFTFRIIMMNMRLGQWNTSVFCFSIIGLRYIHEGRRWGGILLALAITLKFMPVVFLAYLAARRRWKDVGITALATIFWVVLLPIIVLGPSRSIDLMKHHKAASDTRLKIMTKGKEVGSVSMHSTIYRASSPVQWELKGDKFTANVLNLPREQGAMIAKIFSVIFALAALGWLIKQGKKNLQINPLGTLLLIGLCYMFWLIASPGVRHAQLISTTPLAFATVAAAVLAQAKRTRMILIIGLGFIALLYAAPSEIVDDTRYNRVLEASGILAWAMVLQMAVGIFAFYRVGLGSLTARTWEIDEADGRLIGDPRY